MVGQNLVVTDVGNNQDFLGLARFGIVKHQEQSIVLGAGSDVHDGHLSVSVLLCRVRQEVVVHLQAGLIFFKIVVIDFHKFIFAAYQDIRVYCEALLKLLDKVRVSFSEIIYSACWYELLVLLELKAA